MSYQHSNGLSRGSDCSEAEETLRLIARLPAPQGLEDRIQASLRVAAPRRARILSWPSPLSTEWLRTAAAAAIVFVVAGGGWGIYSQVDHGQAATGVVVPATGAHGGFAEGGAVRRPQTLQGPLVSRPSLTVTPKPKAPGKAAVTPAGATTNAIQVKATAGGKSTTPAAAPGLQ